jgi:hypothetical protein
MRTGVRTIRRVVVRTLAISDQRRLRGGVGAPVLQELNDLEVVVLRCEGHGRGPVLRRMAG